MTTKKPAPKWAHALVLALVLSPCVAIGIGVTADESAPTARPTPRLAPRLAPRPTPKPAPKPELNCLMEYMDVAQDTFPHGDVFEHRRFATELCIEEGRIK